VPSRPNAETFWRLPPSTLVQFEPSSLSINSCGGEPEPRPVIVDEIFACWHPFALVMVNGPCTVISVLAGTVPL